LPEGNNNEYGVTQFIHAFSNRKTQNKHREKKEETRRKILLGAYFLDKLRKEGTLEAIKQELDTFLTRNSDRKLFDLPLLEFEKA
jgi:large subunit ribosomal protein L7/L12